MPDRMTHDEAMNHASEALRKSLMSSQPVEAVHEYRADATVLIAYARELRESGAMQPAEQPKPTECKPVGGQWTNRQDLGQNVWLRTLAAEGQPRIAFVDDSGWKVYGPGGEYFDGPEAGLNGKHYADSVASRFYTLEY